MGKRRLPTNAEINVTSLVDVAFTLLVIFIITAPILQSGVEVELPQATSAPITEAEAAVVTVTAAGTIFLGEVEVASAQELATLLPRYLADREARQVWVRGDRAAAYGRVLEVIAIVKEAGIEGVGLVSEPRQPATR